MKHVRIGINTSAVEIAYKDAISEEKISLLLENYSLNHKNCFHTFTGMLDSWEYEDWDGCDNDCPGIIEIKDQSL